MVTYPMEAQTIKSTVQNIGAAIDQRKKYHMQNKHEIYLFYLKFISRASHSNKLGGMWITIYKWHLVECFGLYEIVM